jgi:enoyl-CoA hydratase/carnithine racemase
MWVLFSHHLEWWQDEPLTTMSADGTPACPSRKVTLSSSPSPSPTAEAAVRTERRGDALWVVLNRPGAMNALSHDLLDALSAALAESLETDCACVVITGAGRAFCAGADLKFVQSALTDPRGLEAFLARASGVFSEVERHPLPVVASVNGTTIAGGLELALACDFIVASESAKIGDGHATFGLFPGAGGSVRLPRRIGNARAKLMLYTGQTFRAKEMAEWGLVDHLVAADALEVETQDLADAIAKRSRVGVQRMKRVVNDQDGLPIERALQLELDACALHLRTDDVAEGLRAFNERRTPVFTSR